MMLALQIAYKELERRQTKELNEKRSELQSVRPEIASMTVNQVHPYNHNNLDIWEH